MHKTPNWMIFHHQFSNYSWDYYLPKISGNSTKTNYIVLILWIELFSTSSCFCFNLDTISGTPLKVTPKLTIVNIHLVSILTTHTGYVQAILFPPSEKCLVSNLFLSRKIRIMSCITFRYLVLNKC